MSVCDSLFIINYFMVMKSVTVLGALLVVAALLSLYSSQNIQKSQYQIWKTKFGAHYSLEEDLYRQRVYLQNLQKINKHNSLRGRTYDMGINQFAAMTEEEFRNIYISKSTPQNIVVDEGKVELGGPSVDWDTQGAVTRVKNQGSCVAGYAFSAVGAVEGLSVIYYLTSVELSAQQVVDCSSGYGNTGCTDGRASNAFDWMAAKGVNTQSAYPWTGQQKQCSAQSGSFKNVSASRPLAANCTDLAYYLLQQPVAVSVDGNRFQFYKSGLFSDCSSSPNTGILLTGMTDSYWKAKNSFGSTWGESGYIRFDRGNTCGICAQGVIPTPK